MTTVGAAPISAAKAPDSNSPSEFEAPVNSEFTALTRPRMESGVSICTSVSLMNTLTMSAAPTTNMQASDRRKSVDRPKARMAAP